MEETYPRLEDVFDINVVTLKRNMNKYIIKSTRDKGSYILKERQ